MQRPRPPWMGKVPSVPRACADLAGIVSAILKSDGDDDAAASVSTFVHQALARRKVVVDLIQGAKARCHGACKRFCMDE
eukprot:1991632-Pyramimonas_sp.AAC.1